jgi:Fur family peroxide stress response transcriptional regulator
MSNDLGAGRERVETMADPKDRLDKMIHTLKEHGFRLTPQRLAVLKILAKSDGHPSVETIYERVKPDFPTTSLATILQDAPLVSGDFRHQDARP